MRTLSNDLFRLVWYNTKSDNKFDCGPARSEFLGSKDSTFSLWFLLHKSLAYPHIEIFDMTGARQDPEKGLGGLTGFNV